MAQLTWREVGAPNFSPATDALRTAAGLMERAFSGAQQTLDNFEQSRTDAEGKALRLEMLRYTDPEAFQKALAADPALGRNIDRLDTASIEALGNRTATLYQQAGNKLALDRGNFQFDEEKDKVERAKVFSPFAAEAYKLFANKDEQGALAKLEEGAAAAGLRPDEALAAMQGGFGLTKDAVGIAADRQDMDHKNRRLTMDETRHGWDSWRFGNEQLEWDEERDAQDVAAQLATMLPEDRERALNTLGLSGPVANRVRGLVGIGGGEGAPSSFAGSVSGGGSGDASVLRKMNYEAAGSGFDYVPDNVKTLGQASDFALKVNDANRARIGRAGSSAMGIYQITGQTMRGYAKKLWPKDWRNKNYDFATQDAIGKAIFDDHKHSPELLRKQWVSLSPSEAKRVSRLPWEQAREIIAAGESSSSPAAIIAAATPGLSPGEATILNRGQETAEKVERARGSSLVLDGFEANLGKTSTVSDVVRHIRKAPYAADFEGVSDAQLKTAVNTVINVARKKGIDSFNAAQAVSVLRAEGTIRSKRWFDIVSSKGYTDDIKLTDGLVLDRDSIESHLSSIQEAGGVNGAVDRSAKRASLDVRRTNREGSQGQQQQAERRVQQALSIGLDKTDPVRYAQLVNEWNAAKRAARTIATSDIENESPGLVRSLLSSFMDQAR